MKTIIGFPNDLIEMKKDGSMNINGQKVDEPYATYPDRITGTFKLPNGDYFFLGDNKKALV